MMIRITIVVLAILLLATFSGCGDDNKGSNNVGNKIPPELVGTWTFQKATVDGDSTSLVYIIGSVSARITISVEGSYVIEALGSEGTVQWSETGIFSVNGNSFTIGAENLYFESGTWSVKGNQLTLTVDIAGHTVVIIAARIEP